MHCFCTAKLASNHKIIVKLTIDQNYMLHTQHQYIYIIKMQSSVNLQCSRPTKAQDGKKYRKIK